MFAYIKGRLEIKLNNYVVIETTGVGYKIFISESAMERVGEVGETVKVYTHYHVREDDISLYGFVSSEELRMFELLILVSGIGARSALTILSNILPSEFALAVITNDTSKLVKIPGIGAKTAARIILELKDRLKAEDGISKESAKSMIKNKTDDNYEEAIMALKVLGYSKYEIEKTLEKIDQQDSKVEDIIKKALSYLGR